ncbi:hypothetical protein PLANPX_2737 [Lacipirellula parvula]|uniref:Uncharacterized protein n=1 Tax=Lacipirellula parvula TaxID=2650471 RepID=A0A5K7X9R0_9BACT|nr:hypothetical protein PLANPX_2737 [Lacipirellula parvula]
MALPPIRVISGKSVFCSFLALLASLAVQFFSSQFYGRGG